MIRTRKRLLSGLLALALALSLLPAQALAWGMDMGDSIILPVGDDASAAGLQMADASFFSERGTTPVYASSSALSVQLPTLNVPVSSSSNARIQALDSDGTVVARTAAVSVYGTVYSAQLFFLDQLETGSYDMQLVYGDADEIQAVDLDYTLTVVDGPVITGAYISNLKSYDGVPDSAAQLTLRLSGYQGDPGYTFLLYQVGEEGAEEIPCDASIAQVRSSGQDLTEVVYQLVPETPLSTEANVQYALQIDVSSGELYNNADSVKTTYQQFVPGIAILDVSEDEVAANRLNVKVGGVTAGTNYTIGVSGNSSTLCNETVTASETGNEIFSVSLSKNGVELPAAACGSRLSVTVRTENYGSSDNMSYTVSESGSGNQYANLVLAKQTDSDYAFILTGVNLLLDLYEADPLPAFQLWTYDRNSGDHVQVGIASGVSKTMYSDNRAVYCEFTGTFSAALTGNTHYLLRRADTGEELASAWLSGVSGDEPLTVRSCYGPNLDSDSFAFAFDVLPFTAYLTGCGGEVTAELVDVTGGEAAVASGQGTAVEEGQYSFQIAWPTNFDPTHTYALRFTSGGQSAYLKEGENRREIAYDSEVGSFYLNVEEPVYDGEEEVTFRASPYNCKNLPADYLETNPISLVQSGAEIGVTVTNTRVEYDGSYYMIHLALAEPLAAGTYYYGGTASRTFTVLPSDAVNIGYGSADGAGALSITGCRNLPEGAYTGTLYEQSTWRNGGEAVLENVQLTRVDAGTLKTEGLSAVPTGSYYLEIAVDGSCLGAASVYWSRDGVSIRGYAVDDNYRTTEISYLTTASTIQLQTILPGYSYVRYALGAAPTGNYQPVRERSKQTLALGGDGEKTVYVQFKKTDGTESQVYTWKCKKVASLETPAFVSVSVLVDGEAANIVPENTDFTLRAVVSAQLADVSVKFKEADGSLYYSQTALAYKGETDDGYLFEAELDSNKPPFNSSSYYFTHAVFSLSSFMAGGSGRDVETKEYELTFAGQKPVLTLDDWHYNGDTVYTNQLSYTVAGTATPNSTVTVTWGLPQSSYGTPDESKTRSQIAAADADGRFSATLTGLEVRELSMSGLKVTDSAGLTSDTNSYRLNTLVVDATPPVVKDLRASVTLNSDNSAAITWTVEDANRSYCLLWRDGVLIDDHYQSYNYIALWAEGAEYTVQAVDMAGNVSEPQTIRIRGDEENPTVAVSENTPKEGSLGGTARLTVAGTAADNKELARVELQYSLDGGVTYTPADSTRTFSGESGAWSVTFNAAKDLPSGSVTVKAVAYDASGNTAEARVGTYSLDNTPPAAPAYFFVGSKDGVNIELEWTHDMGEEDFDHFNVYRSDAKDGTFNRIANDVTGLTYQDSKAYTGLNYYYVTAVDKLGNESEHTEILSGENTMDEQAPMIRFITPADGDMVRVTGTDGETITVQIEAADNYKLGSCTVSYGADTIQTQVPEHPTRTHTYIFEIPVSDLGGSPFSLTITVADAGERTAQKTVTYKKYTPPATAANLEAKPTGHKQVELTWTYSGSTDMLHIFAVYRSEDGENFEYAGSVPAVSGQTAYSYMDTVEFTAQSKEYTYRVDAVDKILEEGTTSSMVTVTALSQDAEAPVAAITPAYLTALAGTPFSLSGAASTDNDRIVSYRWDFGDGGTATGADTAHAYAAAGEHTVTLTVTDASGLTGVAECTVDVLEELPEGDTLATFFVCDAQTREALHSAELALVLTDETGSLVYPNALRTGDDGTVTAVLPNGRYRVNVSHPDYNARSIWVELSGGVQRIPDIGLGGALRGELKHKVLSLEEIKAAEIDVNAPGNQHVVKFEFTFGFGAEAIVYDVYRNEYDKIVKIPDRVDGPGCVIYPISEKFALVVYGEAHWLKEMFKVELMVFNDSLTDELNDVTAALTLPDGLSLADMVAGTQAAEQVLGNIKGGGQAAASWYIRGDQAGEYDLSATVKAVSMPFGEPVEETFTAKDKLKVYAGDALHMTIIPDAIARRGEDYHVKFLLTNTTVDGTVNNFSFTVTQAKQYNITKTDHVTVEKLTDETYGGSAFSVNVEELAPGESVEVDFSTTIQFNSILELLKFNRPGRYVDVYYLLQDVWVSTLVGSTTSIPWSVEVNTDVRWPVHWETASKYTTLYGELLDTPAYELLKRYVEVETDAPLPAQMGKGGQIILALDENGELDGARMFIRGAMARSIGDSLDTEVLSGIVSVDGRKLTIQAKAPGTQTVEFGVADSNGQTVNSWIYEITVSGSSGDSAETTESLSGSGSVYEITEDAWTNAVENKREAEIEKLNEDPYQSFNSVLTWTLEDTGTDEYQVTTAPGSIQELLERTAVTHMCIQGGAAALTFDREALEKLAETQEGAVEIAVRHLDTDEAQALGSNRPTYAFTAGGAAAQATVPYAPQSGDSSVYVECLDGEGRATKVLAAAYDSAAQTVSFTVDGSSAYFRIIELDAPAADEGYTIDFRAEAASVKEGYEMSRDADFTRLLAAGETVIPGEKLYVRKAADTALGMPAGPALEILVPERPSAPAVTSSATTDSSSTDGKIMGVTTAMEYSADGVYWTVCSEGEIANLAAGTYQVRLKAGDGTFAGYAASIVVQQGSGKDPVDPIAPVDPIPPVGPVTPVIPVYPVRPGNSPSSDNSGSPSGGDASVSIPDSSIPLDSPEVMWSNPFNDVPESAWYYDAVRFVNENGLMAGVSAGIFDHSANMTRAMLAQILYNRENQPAIGSSDVFTDVTGGAWYYDAVLWAAVNGIVSGYGDGTFGPNDQITREQLVTMLWRYAGSPAASVKELNFTDTGKVSAYALEAVCWAVEKGIINGMGGNLLVPQGLATRAQAAQMLKNYLEG